MSVVVLKSDSLYAAVIAVPCEIPQWIGPRYDGIWLLLILRSIHVHLVSIFRMITAITSYLSLMLSSSSKRKYPPFPSLSYFYLVVCLRCLLHHIMSLIAYTFQENWEFVFIIIVQFMMSANSRMHVGSQIVFVCLYITLSHYQHCKNNLNTLNL